MYPIWNISPNAREYIAILDLLLIDKFGNKQTIEIISKKRPLSSKTWDIEVNFISPFPKKYPFMIEETEVNGITKMQPYIELIVSGFFSKKLPIELAVNIIIIIRIVEIIKVIFKEFVKIIFLDSGYLATKTLIEVCKDKLDNVNNSSNNGLTREKIDIESKPNSLVIMIFEIRERILLSELIISILSKFFNRFFLFIFLLIIENNKCKWYII